MRDTDLTDATWRTSSYSGGNGNCVEVTDNLSGVVAVRDSKDRTGPALAFPPAAWAAFTASIGAKTSQR
ncbi:DUF397 domain-containing protein [Micromonospora sp. LOL_021]|uniref:DUF397 domain-containing protein n=1 Tax=Micromonospora sp. LOL_021 TaxID=3345417 RepID=UPI003A842701